MNKPLDFLASIALSEPSADYAEVLRKCIESGIEVDELNKIIAVLRAFNVNYTNTKRRSYSLDDLLPLSFEQKVFCSDSLTPELSEVIWLKDAFLVENEHWELVSNNINKIFNAYPALFTHIVNIDADYFLKIDLNRDLLLDFEISSLKEFTHFQKNKLSAPKALVGSNLCNIYRIRISDDSRFIVVIEMNHIISDGWSMEIFQENLFNSKLKLEQKQLRFLDFISLKEEESTLNVTPSAYENLEIQSSETTIESSRYSFIQKFCEEMKVSVFTFFHSLLILSEYKLKQNKIVTIGSTANGRDSSDFEKEIYCFIKFVKLKTILKNTSLIDFFNSNNDKNQEVFSGEETLIEEGIDSYSLILILHNFDKSSDSEISYTKLDLLSSEKSTNYVTYNIWQDERNECFKIELDYPKHQFDNGYVEDLTLNFINFINHFETVLDTKIDELCIS